MQLNAKVSYSITDLTSEEFRLISAGLRGTLNGEQIEPALALQQKLFKDRKDRIKNIVSGLKILQEE